VIAELLTATPQTKAVLAEKLGTTSREVELEIHAARLRGVPIYSDQDGYRWPQSAAEVRACADRLNNRVVNQYRVVRALRRAAQRMESREQMEIWAA
jgi:biotin operon repressor